MNAIKGVFQGCLLVVVLACIAMTFTAAGTTSHKPEPTPTPAGDGSAAAVGAVMDGLEPVISAAGRSIDAGTEALTADTRESHPPSTWENVGPTLTTLCVVVTVVGGLVIVAIVWLVIRSGLAHSAIRAIERWGEK